MTNVIPFTTRRTAVLPPSRMHLSEPVGPTGQMPRWWRTIAAYLADLGYEPPHTARSDYDLAAALAMGRNLAFASALLGIPVSALRARWSDLTAVVRDERGEMTIDGQERLLRVLRHRAGVAQP